VKATPLALALLICAGSCARTARGQDEKLVCLAAHGDAQVERNANHLRAARAKLQRCAASTCPELITKDCTKWLAEVEQQQPSIVVAAKDEHGQDLVAVQAAIDGEVVATKLAGTPIEVDPGEHKLRCRLSDGREVNEPFVARENEHARLISVEFPPLATTATLPATIREARGGIPTASWVIGGVGVAAALPWAVFGIWGWADKAHLDSTCKGTCTPGQIDEVKRDFLIADISAGVTIAAAAAAVIVAIVAKPRLGAGAAIVAPARDGAMLGGRF